MLRIVNIIFLLLTSSSIQAQEIYTWKDSSGVTHYSSKAQQKNAKTATLAPITRAEVKLSMKDLQPSKDLTCDKHGGINCQAGPDKDGSVVCFDDYREATARFKFTCSAPKLRITDIGKVDAEGNIKVFVRNANAVVAQKPTIWFKLKDAQPVQLQGPETIGAFEIAEFIFNSGNKNSFMEVPKVSELVLSCANCD